MIRIIEGDIIIGNSIIKDEKADREDGVIRGEGINHIHSISSGAAGIRFIDGDEEDIFFRGNSGRDRI